MYPWSNSLLPYTTAQKPQQVISRLKPTSPIIARHIVTVPQRHVYFLLRVFMANTYLFFRTPRWNVPVSIPSNSHWDCQSFHILARTGYCQFHSANLMGSFSFTTETLTTRSYHEINAYRLPRRQGRDRVGVGTGRQRPASAPPLWFATYTFRLFGRLTNIYRGNSEKKWGQRFTSRT